MVVLMVASTAGLFRPHFMIFAVTMCLAPFSALTVDALRASRVNIVLTTIALSIMAGFWALSLYFEVGKHALDYDHVIWARVPNSQAAMGRLATLALFFAR
jgi:hypothetical protein